MKKIFSILAVVAMVATMGVSCDKDDKGGSDEPNVKARVKTFSLVGEGWADVYQYTYDAQGRVSRVFREEGKDWTFTYKSDSCIVTKTGDGSVAYAMHINAAGYVDSMKDEWDETRTYAYDAKGHMTQVKKEGEVKSNIKVEDGCIATWSKWKDGVEVFKIHSFGDVKNKFKVQNIHSEATDPSRWMFETGMFGVPSDYMCESSKWDYSETTAYYTYEYDENGCPTREIKDYGGEMEYFEYTWEIIK